MPWISASLLLYYVSPQLGNLLLFAVKAFSNSGVLCFVMDETSWWISRVWGQWNESYVCSAAPCEMWHHEVTGINHARPLHTSIAPWVEAMTVYTTAAMSKGDLQERRKLVRKASGILLRFDIWLQVFRVSKQNTESKQENTPDTACKQPPPPRSSSFSHVFKYLSDVIYLRVCIFPCFSQWLGQPVVIFNQAFHLAPNLFCGNLVSVMHSLQ